MEEENRCSSLEQRSAFPLYNDALQGVLKYLNLMGLHVASQVSKQWYQVIRSMKSLARSSRAAELESIPPHSAVGLHVGYVSGLNATFRKSLDGLFSLSSVLPNLRVLILLQRSPNEPILSASQLMSENQPLRLPQQLETFTAAVDYNYHALLVQAIAPLSRLVILELDIKAQQQLNEPPPSLSRMDFSALQPNSLPELDTFNLSFDIISKPSSLIQAGTIPSDSLPRSLIDFLRARTQLKSLDIRAPTFFPPAILQQLTVDVHHCPLVQSGKLTRVGSNSIILSEESLYWLTLIPSITSLAPVFVITNDLHHLSQLVHLKHLRINGRALTGFEQLTSSGLLSAVANCPQLTRLHLSDIDMDDGTFASIVSSLPHLIDLEIFHSKYLTTLQPLISHDLPSHLIRLTLFSCGPLPLSEIESCIFPLQQLEHLMLFQCFQEKIPLDIRQALNHHSTQCRLPKLKTGGF